MRYKLIGLAVCAFALVTALLATNHEDNIKHRYHQHLEEAAYTPCADHGEETFCSHLPLIFIETGGTEIPGVPLSKAENNLDVDISHGKTTVAADGSTTIPCTIQVVDGEEGNNHLTDAPELEANARIRVRGNSSRHFDKKGYLLQLKEKDGIKNREVPLLGMDAHEEWALHGPYLDKSMIRNYMWYNIAGEIMDYAPNVRFCEIFIDGEYQGLYVLMETITNGEDARLRLSQPIENLAQTPFVLRLDRGSSNPLKNIDTFSQYALRTLGVLDIVYPGTMNLTQERIDYIRQDFSDFEKSLYSYDYDTGKYAWTEWADIDSFADYFILDEFTCNADAGTYSTYIYKDVAGKYKMCIWDFNSACDNYQEYEVSRRQFQLQNSIWFWMLTKDEDFVERVISRYRQLRKTYLSEAYLYAYMDDVTEWLGPAIHRNFSLWSSSYEEHELLLPEERNVANQREAVAQMKVFCHVRGDWMDENIEILRQYCHESKVKKFNH